MKHFYPCLKRSLTCLPLFFLLLLTKSLAQVAPYPLYAPESEGKSSCFVGSTIDLTPRDQYESASAQFSASGPIYYFINGEQNPSVLQEEVVSGMVCADPSSPSFPLPGDSALAYLHCDYTATYSSPLSPLYPPHGGPNATNVTQSTGAVWNCSGSVAHPCFAGHTSPNQHTLVTETGHIVYSFVVFAAAANPCDNVSVNGANTVEVDGTQSYSLRNTGNDAVVPNSVTWAVAPAACPNRVAANGQSVSITPDKTLFRQNVTITATFQLRSGARCTKTKQVRVVFTPRPVVGNTDIYRAMNRQGGNWIASPEEGARNSSEMGARIPPRMPADVTPVPAGKEGMVGPGTTGTNGLSASPTARRRQGNDLGKVRANQLPAGLSAIQDGPDHISIYPTNNMKFKEYQRLLNQIPWAVVN